MLLVSNFSKGFIFRDDGEQSFPVPVSFSEIKKKKKGNFEKFPYYRGFVWFLCTYFVSFLDIIVTSKLKTPCGNLALLKLDFYFCLNVCFFNFSWILLLRNSCYFKL